mgnify:CR=1 FL=1
MLKNQLQLALQKIAAGDASALETVYHLTYKKVYALSICILKNRQDAADAMQETYKKILLNNRCNNYVNPEGWIVTIAKNCCFDMLRKYKKNVPYEDCENLLSTESKTEEKEECSEIIETAYKVLKEEERLILFMYTMGDMKHRDIATALKKPYATIRWKYAQAIKKLQRKLNNGSEKDEKE